MPIRLQGNGSDDTAAGVTAELTQTRHTAAGLGLRGIQRQRYCWGDPDAAYGCGVEAKATGKRHTAAGLKLRRPRNSDTATRTQLRRYDCGGEAKAIRTRHMAAGWPRCGIRTRGWSWSDPNTVIWLRRPIHGNTIARTQTRRYGYGVEAEATQVRHTAGGVEAEAT